MHNRSCALKNHMNCGGDVVFCVFLQCFAYLQLIWIGLKCNKTCSGCKIKIINKHSFISHVCGVTADSNENILYLSVFLQACEQIRCQRTRNNSTSLPANQGNDNQFHSACGHVDSCAALNGNYLKMCECYFVPHHFR